MAQYLTKQLPKHCIGAVSLIKEGDEGHLTPAELRGVENAVVTVRRASGAGRILARELCRRAGVPVADIPRGENRAPVWPPGIVGSIAHDATFAAAVVGDAQRWSGVGIDVELPAELSAGVARRIASPAELAAAAAMPFGGTVVFSVKEAIFKAVHPRDGVFLDFHDVVLDWPARTAITRYGRRVHWQALSVPHILAVAWW